MTSHTVADHMTPAPVAVEATDTLRSVSELMAEHDIGAVVVRAEGQPIGIVTDRDVVVRGLATGLGNADTVADVASGALVTVAPGDPVGEAVRAMTEAAVRRLPVVEDGEVVGIVSLGDLAIAQDPSSALADISEAPPTV